VVTRLLQTCEGNGTSVDGSDKGEGGNASYDV